MDKIIDVRSMFSDSNTFGLISSMSSNSYCTPLLGSRIYTAGKLSFPGLYENRSTKSILRETIAMPGSIITFFTSRPTCRNTGNGFVVSVSVFLRFKTSVEVLFNFFSCRERAERREVEAGQRL